MQARAILKASFYALCIDKLCGVWVFYCFPKCCFCCCISADLRPGGSQTYQGLFEERENDSFFKCLSVYVYSRMSVPSKEDNGLSSVCVCVCVWGH